MMSILSVTPITEYYRMQHLVSENTSLKYTEYEHIQACTSHNNA